jgi:hypothetical protein
MSDFKVGDRVACGGSKATVFNVPDTISVIWDNSGGVRSTCPTADFTKLRAFEKGQWVRIISEDKYDDDVGYIINDDGGHEESEPYYIGLRDAVDELNFSASELEIWFPNIGERVIEVGEGNEEEFGTVLSASGDTALILWDDFPHAQMFAIADIEPLLDEDDPNELKEGDRVEYTNPFSGYEAKATVTEASRNIHVVWDILDFKRSGGPFPRDSFTKIAA